MEKKHKIGNVTAGMMIAVAALIDIIQGLLTLTVLLLPLSLFFTFLGLGIFFLWFALCGVKFNPANGKNLLTMLGATAIEIPPFINGLPGLTAAVIGIIVQTRIEDARAAAGGKVTPRTAMAYARLQKMNQARAARMDSAREGREEVQQARHTPANDNSIK